MPKAKRVFYEVIEGEVWRDCPAPYARYAASDYGRIADKETGRILAETPADATHYSRVHIYVKGNQKRVESHRLIGCAWFGSLPSTTELNHKNGDRTDNRPANLEPCSHAENMRHAANAGLMARKLNADSVRAIRALREAGVSAATLAEAFGVASGTIYQCVNRQRWNAVKSDPQQLSISA